VFVGVAVLVGVFVAVLVGVFVGVLVGVFVGVLVGVLVGVFVGVSVGVFVGVFVGVGVSVGVLVGVFVGVLVTVGVLVLVGVAVGASTVVSIVTELLDSTNSGIALAGSTTAVLLTIIPLAVAMKPLMVMVRLAPAPLPMIPKSHSSVPPGFGPTTAQPPPVVLKLVMVKLAGGVSVTATELLVWAEPTLVTTIV
jgi:hypothetical protein